MRNIIKNIFGKYEDFFISYRFSDENGQNSGQYIAEKLLYRPLLKKKYEAHYDPYYKAAGNYTERLQKGVKNCKIFLWVLSKNCLICKSKTETKNCDWYYAEILWALKYNKTVIPVISSDFEWPNQKDYNANINRTFHVLKEFGALDSKDNFIIEKAKKIYRCEGHLECIYIHDDFEIENVLNIVKKARKKDRKFQMPIRFKRRKKTALYCIFVIIVIVLYILIYGIMSVSNEPEIWNGNTTITNGWNSVKGKGTKKEPYQIETSEQLAWLAYSSQENTYAGIYFELENDIYMNKFSVNSVQNGIGNPDEDDYIPIVVGDRYMINTDKINNWLPIGNEDYPFSGYFNGNGYEIKGLYILSEKKYQGLFGVCSEESRIENVNLYCATIYSKEAYVGGIAGKSLGLINQCNVYSLYISGKSYVGGIVGNGNVVSNCFCYGQILPNNPKNEKIDISGGLCGQCKYLINSAASVLDGAMGVTNLSGKLLEGAYNCVLLEKANTVWGRDEGKVKNKVKDRKIYSQKSDDFNTQSSDDGHIEILFDKNVADILNQNNKKIESENESDLYKILLEYGESGNILKLSSWITWENPKGMWSEAKYAPCLKYTYDTRNVEEWVR